MHRLFVITGVALSLLISGCTVGLAPTAKRDYAKWRSGCIKDISNGYCMSNSKLLPKRQDFDYLMMSGRFEMVRSNGDWKVDASELMRDDSLFAVLSRIKSSLHDGDRGRFLSMVSDALRERYGVMDDESFANSPELNGLYASIAATVNPWFELEEKKATCNLAGQILVFENIDNAWTLVSF